MNLDKQLSREEIIDFMEQMSYEHITTEDSLNFLDSLNFFTPQGGVITIPVNIPIKSLIVRMNNRYYEEGVSWGISMKEDEFKRSQDKIQDEIKKALGL